MRINFNTKTLPEKMWPSFVSRMGKRGLIRSLAYVGIWFLGTGFGDSAPSKNNEGNRLYHEKRYEEALKLYRDAQLSDPESPEIHFNIGDALYQEEAYDQAIEAYRKAFELGIRDRELEAQAHYNLGNGFFKKERFEEAVASYRRSLSLTPEDRDFKYNLELAYEKLKEQQSEEKGGGEEEKQDENNGQQDDSDEKEGDQKDETQDTKEKEKGSPPREHGEFTKEEAERILDAVQNKERDSQKKRRAVVTGPRYVGEEW